MAQLNKRVELKSVLIECGVLYVRLVGVSLMLMYSVNHLAMVDKVYYQLNCIIIAFLVFALNIDPNTYFDAHFGETVGPIIWSNVNCVGWESSIQYCSKDSFPNFNCSQRYTVGITCKDGQLNEIHNLF